MATSSSRLPGRFPVGTKFIIEVRPRGRTHVFARHLEFPDGRVLRLPERAGAKAESARRRPRRGH
jgi:hypothetical protein